MLLEGREINQAPVVLVERYAVADLFYSFRRRAPDRLAELPQQRLRRFGRSRNVRVDVFVHLPAFILSSSSARRSIDSSAPSCMPDATMPSRSLTVSKTRRAVIWVLLPSASNLAVCSVTCPVKPSYGNVAQMRTGATTA